MVTSKDSGKALPPTEAVAEASVGARVLDSDVPWFRTATEVEREWARLRRVLGPVFADMAAHDHNHSLSPGERHLMGLYAAAQWTLGGTTEVPMGLSESPVTGRAIRQQLATAEELMVSRGEGWEFGLGVVEWLLWLTGGS